VVNDSTGSTDPSDPDPSGTDPSGTGSSRRWIVWALLGIAGLVVLVYGAIFIYANVINDSPDELDASDLSNALTATTAGPDTTAAGADTTMPPAGETTVAPTGSEAPAASATTPDTAVPDTAAPAPDGFDGDWVPTTASEFGYRVDEVIAGVNVTAVGRSNEIDGLLAIEGTQVTVVDIEVLVENITSDDSRRDGQFRGRIMNASEFPTADFAITEPIELGEIPPPGEQVTAEAVGELTLRGTTNPVEFEVTAEATGDRIGVLGSIPVVFEDYGIPNPSFGAITTEDNGLVEFVLVFERP